MTEVAAARVRRAEQRDLRAVLEIERVSFADPWSRSAFTSALARQQFRFLVAVEGEGEGEGEEPQARGGKGGAALLGYVVAVVSGEEGEIADLAVAPHARRRGIGGLLLDRLAEEGNAAGVRRWFLEVRESNERARRLYASRSFATVGRRRGYYRDPPEDALVLRREFVIT